MGNLAVVLFRVAAALFAVAALLPLLRDEPVNVTHLVLAIAFLILSVTLHSTKRPPPAADSTPPTSERDRPGT